MKGAAHYHSLSAEDNLVLKRAQNVNKLASEVRGRADLREARHTACSDICFSVEGWFWFLKLGM